MLLEEKGAGINAEETLYCITGWLVLGCKLLLDTLSLWVSSSPVCQACIVFSFSCGKSRREKLLLGVQAQSWEPSKETVSQRSVRFPLDWQNKLDRLSQTSLLSSAHWGHYGGSIGDLCYRRVWAAQCCSLCCGEIDNDFMETGQREESIRQFWPPAASRAVAQTKLVNKSSSPMLGLQKLKLEPA